jgi:predicted dehydrogenase
MTEALGDRPLKIAFAGAGMISVFHLTGWRHTPKAEVVAVCDPVRERSN